MGANNFMTVSPYGDANKAYITKAKPKGADLLTAVKGPTMSDKNFLFNVQQQYTL